MRTHWKRQGLLLTTASLLLLYLFLAPFNLPLYELVMFPLPDPRTPDVAAALRKMESPGLSVKEVQFQSKDGNVLHGLFFQVPNTKRVFLFSHGKGNNMYTQLPKARCLCACGASVLMYDYEGFGKSQGRTTIVQSCEDGLAAYDYLVEKEKREPEDIIAMGQSFGSGVTGYLALHRKLAGAVMLSGFSSLMSAGRNTFFWLRLYPDWCFPSQIVLDNSAVFSKLHLPLFIVHGKTDRIIACSEALKLYARANDPKSLLLLPGGHATFGEGDQFALALKRFLQDNKL